MLIVFYDHILYRAIPLLLLSRTMVSFSRVVSLCTRSSVERTAYHLGRNRPTVPMPCLPRLSQSAQALRRVARGTDQFCLTA